MVARPLNKPERNSLLPCFLSPAARGGEWARQWMSGFQRQEVIQDYFWRRKKQGSEVRAERFSGWGTSLIFKRVNLISRASSNWKQSPDLSGVFSWYVEKATWSLPGPSFGGNLAKLLVTLICPQNLNSDQCHQIDYTSCAENRI